MKEFAKLCGIVKKLRSPGGCPWDRKQTVKDFKNYLLEEVYELIEAIETGDAAHVREELGDVMLLAVAIAQLYTEKKIFTVDDALKEINAKLIRRHPHVFGNIKIRTAEKVLENWTNLKNREKKRVSFYDKVPKTVPALFYAYLIFKERDKFEKNRKKLHRSEFDAAIKKKIGVFLSSQDENSYAQLLYALVEWGSLHKINPELSLLRKSHQEAKKHIY